MRKEWNLMSDKSNQWRRNKENWMRNNRTKQKIKKETNESFSWRRSHRENIFFTFQSEWNGNLCVTNMHKQIKQKTKLKWVNWHSNEAQTKRQNTERNHFFFVYLSFAVVFLSSFRLSVTNWNSDICLLIESDITRVIIFRYHFCLFALVINNIFAL